MKTQISRISHDPKKRYSGIYQQQGRMLTDADWNELVDILKQYIQEAFKQIVGTGSPEANGFFKIKPDEFGLDTGARKLKWGDVYIDGLRAQIAPDKSAQNTDLFVLEKQENFPLNKYKPVDGEYQLYVDLWERPIVYLEDSNLRDQALQGADTCTRTHVLAQVKWASKADKVEKTYPKMGSSTINVKYFSGISEIELDPCVVENPEDREHGNYLFRIEVHNVKLKSNGNIDELTIKWSSENAAEQFSAQEIPDYFTENEWVFEKFTKDSERHLGFHPDQYFKPIRWELTNKPTDTTGGFPIDKGFIRRWDGYCIIQKTGGIGSIQGWKLKEGREHNKDLNFTQDPQSTGDIAVIKESGSKNKNLKIILQEIEFTIALEYEDNQSNGIIHTFLAGDYWLAMSRESSENMINLNEGSVLGIKHHYMELFYTEINNGVIDQEKNEIIKRSDPRWRSHDHPKLTALDADRTAYNPSKEKDGWDEINEYRQDHGDGTYDLPETVQCAIDDLAYWQWINGAIWRRNDEGDIFTDPEIVKRSVGIGTDDPGGKLHVIGTGTPSTWGNTSAAIEIDNHGDKKAVLQANGPKGPYRITIQDGNGRVNKTWNAYDITGGQHKYDTDNEGAVWVNYHTGTFSIRTAPGGQENEVIDWNLGIFQDIAGNVGIGRGNPGGKLHIDGGSNAATNDKISTAIEIDNAGEQTAIIQANGPTSTYRVTVQDGNGRVNQTWNAYDFVGGLGSHKYDKKDEGAVWVNYHTGTFSIRTAPGGQENEVIPWNLGLYQDPSGKVGIGTNDTTKGQLNVNGDVYAEGVVFYKALADRTASNEVTINSESGWTLIHGMEVMIHVPKTMNVRIEYLISGVHHISSGFSSGDSVGFSPEGALGFQMTVDDKVKGGVDSFTGTASDIGNPVGFRIFNLTVGIHAIALQWRVKPIPNESGWTATAQIKERTLNVRAQ